MIQRLLIGVRVGVLSWRAFGSPLLCLTSQVPKNIRHKGFAEPSGQRDRIDTGRGICEGEVGEDKLGSNRQVEEDAADDRYDDSRRAGNCINLPVSVRVDP